MKIVDYKVVESDEVIHYMQEGWQPLGGVSHISGTNGLAQAIVKYEETVLSVREPTFIENPTPSGPD